MLAEGAHRGIEASRLTLLPECLVLGNELTALGEGADY
jgi:hypothetical protein